MMDRHGRVPLRWTQPIRQASHGHASPFCHWARRESGRFEWTEGKDFLLNGGQAPGSVEDRKNKARLVPRCDAASVKSGGEPTPMKKLSTRPLSFAAGPGTRTDWLETGFLGGVKMQGKQKFSMRKRDPIMK